MALSADEQRLLDQLEASLRAEDPGLARKFKATPEPPAKRPWWALITGLIVGVVLLATGMLWLWPLSVLGFLVMFAGAIYVALKSPREASAQPIGERADSTPSPW